jgi:hypothetical protein
MVLLETPSFLVPVRLSSILSTVSCRSISTSPSLLDGADAAAVLPRKTDRSIDAHR